MWAVVMRPNHFEKDRVKQIIFSQFVPCKNRGHSRLAGLPDSGGRTRLESYRYRSLAPVRTHEKILYILELLQLMVSIQWKEEEIKNILRFLVVVFCLFISMKPILAQWVQTNRPYGGGIVAMMVTDSAALSLGTIVELRFSILWIRWNTMKEDFVL